MIKWKDEKFISEVKRRFRIKKEEWREKTEWKKEDKENKKSWRRQMEKNEWWKVKDGEE